ncbi:hypothetical protein CRUP_009846 [Coryphaenoides rupestris]|nr:hypothetical protein CRUP_009846 [Coryphaenoides rupestris]
MEKDLDTFSTPRTLAVTDLVGVEAGLRAVDEVPLRGRPVKFMPAGNKTGLLFSDGATLERNDRTVIARGAASLSQLYFSFPLEGGEGEEAKERSCLQHRTSTRGKSPYPSMTVDARFYKMVKCGYHMSRPDFAPPEMYAIMKMCWTLEPTERPTISKITQMIQRLLGDPGEPETRASPAGHYQNVKEEEEEDEEDEEEAVMAVEAAGPECAEPKRCAGPCDPSSEREEEEQPLMMKTNNYQFC